MKSKLKNAMVTSIASTTKVMELQKLAVRLKSNFTRSLDRTESEETQPIPPYDDPLY